MAEPQEELQVDIAGQKVNYKGMHLGNLLQIVIVAAVALGVYILHEMRGEAKAASAVTQQEHGKLGDAVEKGTEAQVEMNYILTLSPEAREKLNLRMPESLRKKVRREM